MREQVCVLPPSGERRKPTSFGLDRRDEVRETSFNVIKESKKCVSSEDKTVEKLWNPGLEDGDRRLEKHGNASISDKIKKEDLKFGEDGELENLKPVAMESCSLQRERDRVLGLVSESSRVTPSCEDIIPLQWGQRKRPRCSRGENHHLHQIGGGGGAAVGALENDKADSSVSNRKTLRVKADKISPVVGGFASSSSPDALAISRSVAQPRNPKVEAVMDMDESRRRPKVPKGVPSSESGKGQRASPPTNVESILRRDHVHALPNSQKQDLRAPYRSNKSRNSGDRNGGSADPVYNTKDTVSAKVHLEWPKFHISLSRKEKEEDFLKMKGTKLPHRPKKRSRTVEKTLHFCMPGTWLTDLAPGRYDVREKKCTKKKPRGLKAMESMDSESD